MKILSETYRKLSVLVDQGSIIFTDLTHPAQHNAYVFYKTLRRDVRNVVKNRLNFSEFDRRKYIHMRKAFMGEIRKIPGFDARFSVAMNPRMSIQTVLPPYEKILAAIHLPR